MDNKELQEYLKTKNCRGCNNRCPLNDPGCGRSKIFIQEAIEKLESNNDNFSIWN